jgi:poly-gamma-glutamate synthase PgsB/CapB
VPNNCQVFTAEPTIFHQFTDITDRKKLRVQSTSTISIENSELARFSYIEHKENIALALEVCKHIGVDRTTALEGMINSIPDPGVLKKYKLVLEGKNVTLVYAMAANDPDSTYQIWNTTEKHYEQINLLINCRDDRIDRSFQIIKLIRDRLNDADNYIITGTGTDVIVKRIHKYVSSDKVLDLGGRDVATVVDNIGQFVTDHSLIFAIGNTVGYGQKMIDKFLKQKG